jgi:hypothetical protein
MVCGNGRREKEGKGGSERRRREDGIWRLTFFHHAQVVGLGLHDTLQPLDVAC